MSKRKLAGIVCMIIGVALIFLSKHIEAEVGAGRAQISRGQSQINTIDTVFSTNSYTRGVGQAITSSGQRRINEGIQQANYYEGVAYWCMIGGVGFVIVGAGLFLIPARRRK